MLRKEYQDKYILKKKKISDIEEESKNIFILFEELQEEVKKSEEKVNSIEEVINKVHDEVKTSEIEITEIKDYNKLNYTTTLLGAGLGSLVILYNPYICIGSIIVGGIFGYYGGSYLNKK
jgi:hypothetical protein